jgi:NAD(P)-dependent dehydrogenase (short-subunit alcohol dehydrogenase family)
MKDGGSIILNGSVASVKGTPDFGVYGATKAALRSFVRTWTSDLKDRHIRSNVISPGPTDTPVIDANLQTPFFWRPMIPVLSRVSSCSLMAGRGQV